MVPEKALRPKCVGVTSARLKYLQACPYSDTPKVMTCLTLVADSWMLEALVLVLLRWWRFVEGITEV